MPLYLSKEYQTNACWFDIFREGHPMVVILCYAKNIPTINFKPLIISPWHKTNIEILKHQIHGQLPRKYILVIHTPKLELYIMWLHQLSTRSNQHIEGILIAQHDTHNSIKRTLINVAKHNSMPQDMIIP